MVYGCKIILDYYCPVWHLNTLTDEQRSEFGYGLIIIFMKGIANFLTGADLVGSILDNKNQAFLWNA
jgi:hypothetical protein